MIDKIEKCGCGRPVRLYKRCPSHEELTETNKQQLLEINKLIGCAQDISMYREGTKYYEEAIRVLKSFEEKYNMRSGI